MGIYDNTDDLRYVKSVKDEIKNETEFFKSMQVLEIKPGDLIVIRHPDKLSINEYIKLRDMIKSCMEKVRLGNDILILGEGMGIGVIRES